MREGRNKAEPPPTDSADQACWDFLFANYDMSVFPEMSADIRARDKYGQDKYGKRLCPNNGRDPEVDLYQELLDAIAYATQALQEGIQEEHLEEGRREMLGQRIMVLVHLAEATRKCIGRKPR